MRSTTEWQGKMKFVAKASSGHEIIMDASEEVGGEDSGTRPKELILNSLAGCTAMDVIAILRKMRVTPEAFRVEVEAEQTDTHPKIFSKIIVKYIFKGDLPEDKIKKAIDLSKDTYCGVSAMLKKSSEMIYEYVIEK